MPPLTRREALNLAAALGASLAWPAVALDGESFPTDRLDVDFVCIPEPLTRSPDADGGPLAYRVTHRVTLWKPGEAPQLERTKVEGTLPLVL